MKFIKILLIFFVLNSCAQQEKVEVDIPIYIFDKNFSKINVKKKVGIDPVSGGTHRMTSDEFFSSNKEKFD